MQIMENITHTWHLRLLCIFLSDWHFTRVLKKQNIKVVFVGAPIYIGLINKVDNLPEFFETFESYSNKYQIPILDYTYYYLSYDTAYFYNATHLNKTGAKLFTTKSCHDLDSLGILKNN